MTLTAGAKLGPYEIQSALGAGGMGEVYRAQDTRLGRDVAIKVLPQHLSSSPELKERFEREARAISSLNHPRICTLHDVGHQNGTDFLVMEYLEGESLAERLKKGPLPLKEALKVAIEVCEALEVAHRAGIIHRDLKPANIMLTKTGAKLMDFGLAKAVAAGVGSGSSRAPLLSATRTMTEANPVSPLTVAGSVIGTIQYMSPEQIEGKDADARSDIFALGAVLYEMTTGNRPFEGKSQISVASAILEKDPDPISVAQPLAPLPFERIVSACLAKNPDDRIQTAHDVKLQLKWIAESGASVSGLAQKRAGRESIAWLVAAALAILLVAVAVWWSSSRVPEHTTYFSAPLPFPARDVAVAPNGHTIAIVGYREAERKSILWIYELGSPEATSVPNTAGANFPFWSPDGRSLGFFADGKLKKLDLNGGPVQTLCDAPTGRGGTWNKDGVILFTPVGLLGAGVFRTSASGGTPTQITFPDRNAGEDSHRWPQFLPDGKHFLFLAMNLSGRKELYSIYAGSLDSKERQLVVQARGNASYATPGYLLFFRDQTLFAQRFDDKTLKVSGEPTPLLTDVQYSPRIARAMFSATSSGLLVAQRGAGIASSRLAWFDRKGQEIAMSSKPAVAGLYGNMQLSPNGKSVAVDTTDPASQNTDIWTYDLDSQNAARLTFDASIDTMPVWSPDGSQLIFASNRELKFDLFLKNANGAQAEKIIPQEGSDRFPTDWSSDGKYVLFERGSELWYLTLPDQTPTLFLKEGSNLRSARFSPDGRWVAYASNESGRLEIYVTSFPDARGKWQVSNAGGDQPHWRGDGKELFYLSSDGKIMAAAVTTGARFETAAPVVLFQADAREMVATSEQVTYDVTKDGQRFLINTRVAQSETLPMSIVLNWSEKVGK